MCVHLVSIVLYEEPTGEKSDHSHSYVCKLKLYASSPYRLYVTWVVYRPVRRLLGVSAEPYV